MRPQASDRAWLPLRDPSELEQLTPAELFLRVRPLLRRGGLCSNRERLERVLPNLPSVSAELAAGWRLRPFLNGVAVGFGDYLAARLCTRLHQLDQEQYPELYDNHRRYQPDAVPGPLPDEAGIETHSLITTDRPLDEHRDIDDWRHSLQQALESANIAAASQAALLTALDALERGEITSPYRLQRALGNGPLDARQRPATSTYLAARELLGDDPADSDTNRKSHPPSPAPFQFQRPNAL